MEEPQDPKVRIRQEREQLKLTRGKLIRRARELLGLSQEELALKINGAGITVSRWEREIDQDQTSSTSATWPHCLDWKWKNWVISRRVMIKLVKNSGMSPSVATPTLRAMMRL